MSGLARRIKRNRDPKRSGFGRTAKNLNAVLVDDQGGSRESFPSKARRYVRETIRFQQMRLAQTRHRPPPEGMKDRAPASISP